jgi:hypothetical protein
VLRSGSFASETATTALDITVFKGGGDGHGYYIEKCTEYEIPQGHNLNKRHRFVKPLLDPGGGFRSEAVVT